MAGPMGESQGFSAPENPLELSVRLTCLRCVCSHSQAGLEIWTSQVWALLVDLAFLTMVQPPWWQLPFSKAQAAAPSLLTSGLQSSHITSTLPARQPDLTRQLSATCDLSTCVSPDPVAPYILLAFVSVKLLHCLHWSVSATQLLKDCSPTAVPQRILSSPAARWGIPAPPSLSS
jgi:hypothetical protein